MRRFTVLFTVLATMVVFLAPAAVATPSNTETQVLIQDGGLPIVGASGNVTLTRRDNGTFSWKLKATGLTPGHAFTVWVGDWETGFNDGGHGGSGLAGGSGGLTVSGNHCIRPLDPSDPTGFTGGFVPGSGPDCGLVDASGVIGFFLIDHGDWQPGDQSARRTPGGGGLEGVMLAFFVPA